MSLESFYASAPVNEVPILTLEVRHGSFLNYRICSGYEPHRVTRENGAAGTFHPVGLDVSLPRKDGSGVQKLVFAIEGVSGQTQAAIKAVLDDASTSPVKIVYREYLLSDLSYPAAGPLVMNLAGAYFKGSLCQMTCAYQDVIGLAWPRRRYTVAFAPGLKYL